MKKKRNLMLFTLQVFNKDRGIFFVSLIFVTVLRVLAPILVPFIIKEVLNLISYENYYKVVFMVLVLFVLFICMVVIAYFVNTYVDTWLTKLVNKNAGRCYEKLAEKDYGELIGRYSSEEMFTRIMAGSGNCVAVWVNTINIISTIISVLLLFLMANRLSFLISLVTFIVVIVDTIRIYFEWKKNEKYAVETQKINAKLDGGIYFLINEIEFLKLNHVIDKCCDNYKKYRESFFKIEYKKLILIILLDAFTETIVAFIRTIFSVIIFHSYNKSFKSTVGDIGASFSIFDEIRDKSGEIRDDIAQLPHCVTPLQRLNELLVNLDDVELFKKSDGTEQILFSLQNIFFNINDKNIINDLSLTIKKGEKIAIIGENGSGKSTLLKLLIGKYNPQKGNIIRQSSIKGNDISYIPSNPQLYNLSASQNILMGTEREDYEDMEVIQKILVSNTEEKNYSYRFVSELSGGQNQRVNIARAYVGNHSVMIADEPTASLDNKTSHKVMNSIIDSAHTVIFTTHDISMLSYANRVITISNGKILQDVVRR